jgi:hypothetical protein
MQFFLKQTARWWLLAYTFLLCFIISQLPINHEKLGGYSAEIFARIFIGIGLFLLGGAFYFQHQYDRWFSVPWVLLNVFVLVSVSMLYFLFRHTHVGLNGWIGDAYFNAAMITKYKYFHTLTDFNYLKLSTSYPALYHYLVGKLAAWWGVESYKAVKTGYYLVYGILSILFFMVLKKSVGELTAAAAIFFLFLFFPVDNLFKPYEFITALLFLGWWLAFVECDHVFCWKRVGLGGALGAFIFATYYYWFFIAIVYLIAVFLAEWGMVGTKAFWIKRKQTIFLLATAAILSSFYWLPLFADFVRYGVVSLQNMWFSEDMAQFNIWADGYLPAQVITLAGMAFILLFSRHRVMQILLKLLLAIAFWTTLHFAMLYFKTPLVAHKLHYLIYAIGAVGFFYGLLELIPWSETIKKNASVALFLWLMLIGGDRFISLKNHPYYREMSRYRKPHFQQNRHEVEPFKNKVMLTDRQHINVYIPVHYFLNVNAHFSHPASRFRQRVQFLQDLQAIDNPSVVAWFLAYNIFDKVNLIYFENQPTLYIYDDNFPYGHQLVTIHLHPSLLQSEFLRPYGTLPDEQGVIFELKPPPYELKNSFTPHEHELAKKYGI